MSKRLPDIVKSAFHKAKAANDLTYYPTQVIDIPIASLPFQLRFSPSLANKPKGPPKSASQPFDPFAYSPLPKLFITDLSPTHYLVLNKFAITEEHFILATREFKPQTHVLEQSDLEGALECVRRYKDDGGLFVFFNGGDHSGASQPHRHLQLLPVQRMKDGLSAASPWEVLASRIGGDDAPFATFAEKITLDVSAEELYAAYLRLYRKSCEAAGVQGQVAAEGVAMISYNLAMTEDVLVVCPRVAEGGAIYDDKGEEVGKLSLNGTMLAGTALVKSQAEWDALKANPQTLAKILNGVGLPKL